MADQPPTATSQILSYCWRKFRLISSVTLSIALIYLFFPSTIYPSTTTPATVPTNNLQSHHSKYAYCSFLAPYAKGQGQATGADLGSEDHYLVGTRMLIYQLLHDPITRTQKNIPFVVLVTTDVPQQDRDRLTRDGATIIEVSPIKIGWIKPGRDRWARVMDKLGVLKLTQFEKVLLLDSDVVIVKPLDAIFEDPAAQLSRNLGRADKIREDEAVQPATYIMAGNAGPTEAEHPYPAPRGGRLNAGFVLLKPSLQMFEHYMSVAAIEGRFPGGSPEQDLWNYVHRRDGNMPWKQVDPDWTANTPIYNDYEHGIASFHEKYWGCGRDRRLRDVLLRSRFKMEGFFDSRDAEADGNGV
ncbi:nucleotide-diphospho-sugar transferase [Hyaloscypha sp. PMI_1271]|nr:nucleotide-diphospho-sugar transferase [Hyaloscypha sp. PMI_1271]